MLGGVCGGLGEYLNVDPTLIRLLWVVFSLVYGIGILAYILAWIIVPERPEGVSRPPAAKPAPIGKLSVVVGVAFALLGAILLLFTLSVLPWSFRLIWRMMLGRFWPSLLVLIGIALIAIGLLQR